VAAVLLALLAPCVDVTSCQASMSFIVRMLRPCLEGPGWAFVDVCNQRTSQSITVCWVVPITLHCTHTVHACLG
jgi:hypothetical protein